MTLLEQEHACGLHDAYQPGGCAECWPNGGPITTPPPSPSERTAPPAMESLAAVIGRLRERHSRLANADPAVLDERQPPADGGPDCGLCRGTRWMRRDVDVTDPQFGKAVPCPECSRGFLLQQRLDRLWGSLPDLFKGWTMQTFRALSPIHDEIGAAIVAEWLEDPAQPWLFVWGESGLGKTGLAVAIMYEYTLRGQSVVLKITGDLLDKLRDSYHSRAAFEESGSPWLESLYSAELVVLDDLGSEYHRDSEDWAAQKIFQVIGGRHDRKMRTIITSNYSLTELKTRLGHARTPSRIDELATDRWVLDFNGLPNMRRAAAMKGH